MQTFSHTIKDPLGIHARPAGQLVKCASAYESVIIVQKAEKTADCKRLFALMCLGARCGDTLVFSADGPDADAACKALQDFCRTAL